MDETFSLMYQMRDLHAWPGHEDPKAWNLTLKEPNEGYYWDWKDDIEPYPNPGRRALVIEIKKIIGDEEFEKKYGQGRDPKFIHQNYSHEGWMKIWISVVKEKQKIKEDIFII